MVATDIFEIHIDALRCGCGERGTQVAAGLVVNYLIDTAFVFEPLRLLIAAATADDAATLQFGDLTNVCTNRTRRGRNENSVAGFGLAELK